MNKGLIPYIVKGALHVMLVAVIYALYHIYPPYAVPIPFFDTLVYIVGGVYGVAGIWLLRQYVKAPVQADFNYAVLVIFCGWLIFMAESLGNAA